MEDLEYKIEVGELRIKARHSRFKNFIMSHQHLIHIFLFILCHELFGGLCKALNFPLEDDS